MKWLYLLGVKAYYFAILLASLFNYKARLWIEGRKGLFRKLEELPPYSGKTIWFHCASLGEFEQGRPVIEQIKRGWPEYRVVLTFFSPSGYEIRKNYGGADIVSYLPLDSASNARKWIATIKPDVTVFIKYEFWFYYLFELKKMGIPTYLVSAIFRPDQHFFKWYGGWFRNGLRSFKHLFVQNEKSKDLLENIGFDNVSISGDTRFDRVWEVAQRATDIELIDKFSEAHRTIVVGSSWPEDESLLAQFINQNEDDIRYLIAPHEIEENKIEALEAKLKVPSCRYTYAMKNEIPVGTKVLIIDTIGILSQIYRYGSLAYIGGGFGSGIHNVLEAATFGIPILFGPNYSKFKEAIDLIEIGGAFSIRTSSELQKQIHLLLEDEELLKNSGLISRTYVNDHIGATKTVVEVLKSSL